MKYFLINSQKSHSNSGNHYLLNVEFELSSDSVFDGSITSPWTKSDAAASLPDVPVIRDPGVFPSAGQNSTSVLAVPLVIRNDLAEADDLALFCCL